MPQINMKHKCEKQVFLFHFFLIFKNPKNIAINMKHKSDNQYIYRWIPKDSMFSTTTKKLKITQTNQRHI